MGPPFSLPIPGPMVSMPLPSPTRPDPAFTAEADILLGAAAQIERTSRELESFFYAVSHDLRAPLRAIDGWADALEQDAGPRLDEEARGDLARLRADARRMERMLDGLLQLSRLSGAARSDSVDLSALAEAIAREIQSAEPERRFRFHIQPGMHAPGDARLLSVALGHLMRNAAKFTAGRDEARIAFSCAPGRDPDTGLPARLFAVADNGTGFDASAAGRLFGLYQRLHAPTEFPGSGVGLATVRRIIHRHGGGVWAESTPGAGATFRFTLSEAGVL